MLTIVLALVSALAFALSDLFSQRLTRRGAAIVSALVWIVGTGVLLTLPLGLLLYGEPTGSQATSLGYAAAGGVLYLIAYASLLRGLRGGNLSVVTPLAGLQGAVAAAIAVALGERLDVLTALGLTLAVVGGLLAAVGRRSATGHRGTAGAGWALLTAAVFGISLVLYGRASAVSPVSAVAASRTVTFALLVPFALRSGLRVPARLRANAVGVGFLEAGGFLLLVWALARGPVAVASVLGAQFATFAVVLGLVVLRERPAPRQLFGVLCTIVAITLLALGQ